MGLFCSTCQPATTLRLPWLASWSRPADSSIPANYRECSRYFWAQFKDPYLDPHGIYKLANGGSGSKSRLLLAICSYGLLRGVFVAIEIQKFSRSIPGWFYSFWSRIPHPECGSESRSRFNSVTVPVQCGSDPCFTHAKNKNKVKTPLKGKLG
jgi:hypothetical protein